MEHTDIEQAGGTFHAGYYLRRQIAFRLAEFYHAFGEGHFCATIGLQK